MTAKGSELIFISRIEMDGCGVIPIGDQTEVSHLRDREFRLTSLSITHGTYIASSSFYSYVVKKKEEGK